jgi:hypothetical protein
MTCRELPRAEWPQLAATELGQALEALPADTRVVVVEHHGAIVGCWAVMTYTHVEGLWVAPQHRGRGGVLRRLRAGIRGLLLERGDRVALTCGLTPDVVALIEARGGTELPGRQFAIPVERF